jgi:putative membrane protein
MVWDTPIVMAAAWIIVPAFAIRCVRSADLTGYRSIFAMTLLITSVDLLIEPVAVGGLNLWVWTESGWYYGVPASNFLGWLIVSFVVSLVTHGLLREARPVQVSAWVERSMLGFFVVLNLVQQHWLAAAVGIAILSLDCLIDYRARGANPTKETLETAHS